MSQRLNIALMPFCLLLAACAHHPLDCAVGIYHPDCLPDTAGYVPPPSPLAMCQSYGFVPGTMEYANCAMQVDQNLRTSQQANMAMQQQAAQAMIATQQQNAALQQQNAQAMIANLPRPNLTVTCNTIANTTTCR